MHSKRQLYTIKTFGKEEMVGPTKMCLHVGCMGCGKTYSLVEAFGLYCLDLKKQGIEGLNFVLLGRTQQTVKKNMCNVLSNLFGTDFKYDSSRASGKVKDATLFNQNLFIIGFNDSSSESKFRGLSNVMGILHDEAVFCTKEQFDLIMSRLRGQIDVKLPKGYVKNWYIGSTNPDSPKHFLLDYMNKKIIKSIKWYMRDACWEGAKEYFKRLKMLYKDNQAFYERYIKGNRTSADNMVYPMFYYKKHVLENMEIDYTQMKRTFLGVDYGSNHPTAILLISKSWSGEYIVSKECKLQRTAVSDIVLKIAEYIEFLKEQGVGCDNVYVDPSAVALKDELTKQGITYYEAANSHADGIGKLRNLFSLDQLFILDNCEELVSEIYSYVFKDNNSGKDEVVKINDDLVDAMRYGIYTDSIVKE